MQRNNHTTLTQVIATCVDPQGRKIHIQNHAVDHAREHHPELDINKEDIIDKVENPDLITESNTVADSIIYIKITDESFDEHYYNVFAKIKDKFNDGIVTSAYTSDNRKGGKILWEK